MTRRKGLPFLLIVLASPAVASPVDWNLLAGWGIVGPAQFDQGLSKPMATANATGVFRVGERIALGGAGIAIRATYGGTSRFLEKDNFDEFGLAVPFVTYRRGKAVGQIGVELQRANLRKNFYYMAIGVGLGGHGRERSLDPKDQPTSAP